jgi:hypothetical protein
MATNCTCEPGNVAICSTACVCRPGPTALNGNKIVALNKIAPGSSSKDEAGHTLTVRISHIAGSLCCVILDTYLFGILLIPVLLLCWAFGAIETEIELRRGAMVDGTVTRRSGCCTWRTHLHDVTRVATQELGSDAESLPKMHLYYAVGAAKAEMEISNGITPGLEPAVNDWIAGAIV